MDLKHNKDYLEDFVIVPVRKIPRDYAKLELKQYLQQAGNRQLNVSELVEELNLDIELIVELLEELN